MGSGCIPDVGWRAIAGWLRERRIIGEVVCSAGEHLGVDAAASHEGLMDSARHVIKRI
jgi:hypothetical protein